jgi:hypothetical protein
MRAITQQSVAAFMEGRPFSKANTEVHVTERPGEVCTELRLHGNTIARRWEVAVAVDGSNAWTEITTAGWNTVTTRERLNGIPGVAVHQSKHVLHLNDEPWHGAWAEVTA